MNPALDTPRREDDRTARVVRRIIERHHAYATSMITVLTPLMRAAVRQWATAHPAILRASATFDALARAVAAHQQDDENALFPALLLPGARAQVRGLLTDTGRAHAQILRLLTELAEDTAGFTPPETALATLYRALHELAVDVETHVNLERNVLFPRVHT